MCPESTDAAETTETGQEKLRLWVCVCPDDNGTLRIVAHRGRPLIAQHGGQLAAVKRMAQEIMRDRAVTLFIVETVEVGIEEVEKGSLIHVRM